MALETSVREAPVVAFMRKYIATHGKDKAQILSALSNMAHLAVQGLRNPTDHLVFATSMTALGNATDVAYSDFKTLFEYMRNNHDSTVCEQLSALFCEEQVTEHPALAALQFPTTVN